MNKNKLKEQILTNDKAALVVGIFQQITGCSIEQMIDAADERAHGIEHGPATLDVLRTIDETARKSSGRH